MNNPTKYRRSGPPRFAHQTEGLRRLIKQRGVGALLMDPGLGKTSTTIDYLGALAHTQGRETRVLVLGPLAATDTWVTQLDKWLGPSVNYWAEVVGGKGSYTILRRAETLAARGGRPFVNNLTTQKRRSKKELADRHLNAHLSPLVRTRGGTTLDNIPDPRLVLLSMNIDSLRSRSNYRSRTVADVMVEAVERFDPDVLVVDEMHMIKGAGSNMSRLVARLSSRVPRRIGLTGTVMPHSPLDVFAQWRFLDPHAFGTPRKEATYSQFEERFTRKGGYMGKEVIEFRNLDEMQDIMGQLAVVAKKEDALDLPATTDTIVRVDLSPQEAGAYANMKKQLATQFRSADGGTSTASAATRLVQGLRLRQITAGHIKSDDGTVRTLGSSKASTARSLVYDTLVGEKRIVVFALFRPEIAQIAAAMEPRRGEPATEVMVIDGSTPAADRLAMRQRFGSDDPARIVMVAQVRTMSLAVNELVTASHAIFATLSQQRDHYVQARDRLNRLGQTRPVTFWHLIAPGTVDEAVLDAHQNRGSLENSVLRHILDETA